MARHQQEDIEIKIEFREVVEYLIKKRSKGKILNLWLL